MDIALIEIETLLDELRNRFTAFTFAGLCREEDDPDETILYSFHGGTIPCIGISTLLGHTLRKCRKEYRTKEDET